MAGIPKSRGEYRLHVFLDASYGERLAERAAKSKLSKTAVVALALDQYFRQADMVDKMQAEMIANPVKLAEVCKAFGITPEQ